MRRSVRPDRPGYLREHGGKWSEAWVGLRERNPKATFQWYELEGQSINHRLNGDLGKMTAGHCAYCDGFPLGETSRETIDHFWPKSTHPCLAYEWLNLFPCCDRCQGARMEVYTDALLKPDADDYSFERYFLYNVKSGELDPNPCASAEDQERARETIRLFGLNLTPRPESRKRWWGRRGEDTPVEDRPYRFIVEAGL